MLKSAHLALTFAAFLAGVAVGRRLGRGREPTRSYDREAAALAQEAKARAVGMRWFKDRWGEQHGSTSA